ncbi:MAG: type II secretion system protein [Peptostreptococcaceae bacterium]
MLKKLNKKNNKGFTLVELLVVIAIIGILAVVAVPSLFNQMDKAKATNIVANIKAIQTEALSTYAANGNLTTTSGLLDSMDELKGSNKVLADSDVKYAEVYAVVALTDGNTEPSGQQKATKLGVKVSKGTTTKEGILAKAAQQLGVTPAANETFIVPVGN